MATAGTRWHPTAWQPASTPANRRVRCLVLLDRSLLAPAGDPDGSRIALSIGWLGPDQRSGAARTEPGEPGHQRLAQHRAGQRADRQPLARRKHRAFRARHRIELRRGRSRTRLRCTRSGRQSPAQSPQGNGALPGDRAPRRAAAGNGGPGAVRARARHVALPEPAAGAKRPDARIYHFRRTRWSDQRAEPADRRERSRCPHRTDHADRPVGSVRG